MAKKKADTTEPKVLVIDNPNSLPLVPLRALQDFQGDLKLPDPQKLKKLANSIIDHGVFIAKAIFYEDGIAYTEDGHQTLRALRMLQHEGYTECVVVSFEMKDGRLQESARQHHPEIMVPCQTIVPQGETREQRFMDAAAKLLQINSEYASFNNKTTFFEGLGFSPSDLDHLLSLSSIPEFKPEMIAPPAPVQGDEYADQFAQYTDETAVYPIVRRYSESYHCVFILMENDIDLTAVQEALDLNIEVSYKNTIFGQTYVISAERFLELWRSRSK